MAEKKVDSEHYRKALSRVYERADITKEVLEDLYNNQGLSVDKIAKQLKSSRSTITGMMTKYGVATRSFVDAGKRACGVYDIDDSYFDKIDNYDKAYFLGLISTDGALLDRKKSKRLSISLSEEDGYILDELATRLGSPDLVKHSIKREKDSWSDVAKLVVSRTRIVEDLVKHGAIMSPHSGIEQFVTLPSIDLTWAYLRGVFDAEGCVRVYYRNNLPGVKSKFSITSGYPLVNGVRNFMLSQGIPISKKCVQPKGKCAVFEISKPSTILSVFDLLYKYGNLRLNRKYDKFLLLNDIVRPSVKAED